jgi:two-component system, response regulator / RNA-binding antiterminator
MDPALRQSSTFEADPTPKVVVDRDYVVRAANPAYCRVTERDHDELMSVFLFDAFPNNPRDPEADGVENAMASFERVLVTGQPDNMLIQRHDIPDPRRPDAYLRRHWLPVHSPIRSADNLVGILVQICDVTLLREDVRTAMEYYRAVLATSTPAPAEAEQHQRMVDALTDGVRHFNALADEVTHLRKALTTRGTIERAKGLLMMSERCGPDEAFDILRRTSRQSNQKLADVAAQLVQQFEATT